MAVRSKKDVLIEEAQKFVQRSQFDKAAKTYEQILALDPTAINVRQKLAELLVKCGLNDDARKELETIGKHFSKNGFYLKAIAVYKQLQKLFSSDISLSLTLAELNEKLGLIANALSEYKSVYEFHEKAGNTLEALNILDRMQNTEPQSVPIKIKLAEAYSQQGMKVESYALFAKTASLLSERGDNATLSKICTRIQNLFPEKTDFMLEMLSEQVSQGNAASAIESIQRLLRSNPNNKSTWDLAILAYQQLEQPQRVKVAYQHYLKFFPAEPTAMYGLISAVTTELDIAGVLELLDKYEADLISAGFLKQLEQTYHSLDKIDPISIRVLEGLVRVATAVGDIGEVNLLNSKLKSLRSVSGGVLISSADSEASPDSVDDESCNTIEISDLPFLDRTDVWQSTLSASESTEAVQSSALSSGIEHFASGVDTSQCPEEDIEIDIEIDLDATFGSLADESKNDSVHVNWLDSVGDLFNSIDTAPSVVKFGNEMENSDAQSHFDLGQAFKEMGLYDEAINEFRQASQDTSRRIECHIMQCACLKERGEVEKAITMLQTLLKTELRQEDVCAVKFELVTAYETVGDSDTATLLLKEINSINPGFRDIRLRLNAANQSESFPFSDNDLDEFGFK